MPLKHLVRLRSGLSANATANDTSRHPKVFPSRPNHGNFFAHRPSPDGSKMAIIWPFSEFFCLPGHFFGCWDHIYAYNWGKLNQKTCHIYGVVVRNHSGHGQPPVWRRGFGCLEVPFADNPLLSLTRCFRGTSSFHFYLVFANSSSPTF